MKPLPVEELKDWLDLPATQVLKKALFDTKLESIDFVGRGGLPSDNIEAAYNNHRGMITTIDILLDALGVDIMEGKSIPKENINLNFFAEYLEEEKTDDKDTYPN